MKKSNKNEAASSRDLEALKEVIKVRKCKHGIYVDLLTEVVAEKIKLIIKFFCDRCRGDYAKIDIPDLNIVLACA